MRYQPVQGVLPSAIRHGHVDPQSRVERNISGISGL
jgi:hypothetical protein